MEEHGWMRTSSWKQPGQDADPHECGKQQGRVRPGRGASLRLVIAVLSRPAKPVGSSHRHRHVRRLETGHHGPGLAKAPVRPATRRLGDPSRRSTKVHNGWDCRGQSIHCQACTTEVALRSCL